jgi:hypothetical protein
MRLAFSSRGCDCCLKQPITTPSRLCASKPINFTRATRFWLLIARRSGPHTHGDCAMRWSRDFPRDERRMLRESLAAVAAHRTLLRRVCSSWSCALARSWWRRSRSLRRALLAANLEAARATAVLNDRCGGVPRDWYRLKLTRVGRPLQARMRGNRYAGDAVIHLRAAAASDVPKTRT